MKHAITILAEGFEETEAVTVIDLLRRAGIQTTVLGLASREVEGAHGITVVAEALLSDLSGPFDAIILPGGMPGAKNLAESDTLLDLIRTAHANGILCAAICAAPMVLGRAGILAGVKATCYPSFEKELAGASVVEETVVRDKNVITSRGAGTAIPFALELIGFLKDQATAEKVRKSILFGE